MLEQNCIKVSEFDPGDPLIERFQIALFREHGLKFAGLRDTASRTRWDEVTSHLGRDLNDCYRWLPYRLTNKVHTCWVIRGGEPVHASFTERYGDFLRIGVNFYTLKQHRTAVMNPMWDRSWGYFNQLLEQPVQGHFVTYYEANPKLSALVRMLRKPQRQSGALGGTNTWLREFQIRGEPIQFNGVPQHVSYRDNRGQDAWSLCMDSINTGKHK